ncbi:MAG: phosphatidylglycerophosphatase A [Gammaproteobacteria bacterium]|jgi:phosphatidylglycerophosphatase A|nr:phosphatidylglycerophosphatase A [Gammaproteobacteria bacterium]
MLEQAKPVMTNPVHFLAFGFGAGLSPKAPGTMGTLVAVPLFLLLAYLPVYVYLALITAAFLVGIYLCGRTASDLGVHDHGGIVWDEFVGYWITMILVPVTWYWVLAGFVLFRVFDILKPFPIGWLDKKVGGGLGIMIDDVLAGVYALICLQVLVYLV